MTLLLAFACSRVVSNTGNGDTGPVEGELPFVPVAAAFDAATGEIVMVASEPAAALHALDPVTGAIRSAALSRHPEGVRVHGGLAAVTHRGALTVVDLAGPAQTLVATTGEGHGTAIVGATDAAFWLPHYDAPVWVVPLDGAPPFEVDVAELEDVGAVALHPDGERLFGVPGGRSPADLHAWRLGDATLTWQGDSPFHGDYEFDGIGTWITPDGERLVTTAGDVFRLAGRDGLDLTWAATFDAPAYAWGVATDTTRGRLYATGLGAEEEAVVYAYDLATLAPLGSATATGPGLPLLDGLFVGADGGVYVVFESPSVGAVVRIDADAFADG